LGHKEMTYDPPSQMMLEELERRNYAQTTRDCYIQTIEDFARYFKRPPDQLGPEHIREYQAYLFRERKLAAHTVTQRLAALRFFFIQTMKRRMNRIYVVTVTGSP
jgi:integrase/recombinase XerD